MEFDYVVVYSIVPGLHSFFVSEWEHQISYILSGLVDVGGRLEMAHFFHALPAASMSRSVLAAGSPTGHPARM